MSKGNKHAARRTRPNWKGSKRWQENQERKRLHKKRKVKKSKK